MYLSLSPALTNQPNGPYQLRQFLEFIVRPLSTQSILIVIKVLEKIQLLHLLLTRKGVLGGFAVRLRQDVSDVYLFRLQQPVALFVSLAEKAHVRAQPSNVEALEASALVGGGLLDCLEHVL